MTDSPFDGWDFHPDHLTLARSGQVLLNPSLDLGSPCNLNCPYCFIEEKGSLRKSRKVGEITREQTFAVLQDFVEAGARSVNLVGSGEPTVDPCFGEVVETLWKSGVRTVVFTNGIKIAKDPEMAEFLFEHGASVVLKWNANSSALQDAVVGREGYSELKKTAFAILEALGFNSVSPTRLAIDTLAFKGNLSELPDIHRWARRRNVYPLTADFIPTGRSAGNTVADSVALNALPAALRTIAAESLQPLSNAERSQLVDHLKEIDRELGIQASSDARAYYGGGRCTQLLGVYVDILGNIWPCVARQQLNPGGAQPLGTLQAGDSASEVWRKHPYMRWIRETYSGACPYKPSLEGSASTPAKSLPRMRLPVLPPCPER